jgi:hypothetical protein
MATHSEVPAPAPLFLNAPQEIEKRVGHGQIRRAAALSFLPARIVFMLLGQAIFAVVFKLQGHASPWRVAGAWWTVWGTLVDVGCLVSLFFDPVRKSSRSGSSRVLASWGCAQRPRLLRTYLSILFVGRTSRQLARLPLLAGRANASGRSLGAPLAAVGCSLFPSDLVACGRSRRSSPITDTSPRVSPLCRTITGFLTAWWDSGGRCSILFYRSSLTRGLFSTGFSPFFPACSFS